MEKKDIEYFREVLTNHLEELLNHADNTVSGMTAPKENLPDPTDRASLLSKRLKKPLPASKTIHTRFVKSAVKIFPLLVSKQDLLQPNVLTAKQKKKLLREPLGYDHYIPF